MSENEITGIVIDRSIRSHLMCSDAEGRRTRIRYCIYGVLMPNFNYDLCGMSENEITGIIIDKCINIHRRLGPGLYESVYSEILFHELLETGLYVIREKPIPVYWNNLKMEVGYRADFFIEDKVVVELKSIEALSSVHRMQVNTYVKLLNVKVGLLINFNVDLLKNGICRVVNGL